MALTFSLFCAAHTPATVDLVGGDAKLTKQDWSSYPEGNFVTETFLLAVKDTSRANVRAAFNDVVEILERAREYHASELDMEPVWLRFYTDGESMKQALVYDYQLSPVVKSGISQALDIGSGLYAFWQLAITRAREWEASAASFENAEAGVSIGANGGDIDATAITGGQVPGRILPLRVLTPSTTFAKFWIGFHRLRAGSAGDVVGPVNLGTAYTDRDTTITATAATDTGSNVAICDFSTLTDWYPRAYGTLPQSGAGSAQHYTGRWLVLLRAKRSGTAEALVRVSVSADDIYLYGVSPVVTHQGPPAVVSSDEYQLYELGEIQLPVVGNRAFGLSGMTNVRLNIEARLISGSGSLYADNFILIPAEYMVTVTGVQVGSGDQLYVSTAPTGETKSVVINASGAQEAIGTPSLRNFAWPKEGAIIIAAFERATGVHVIADTVEIHLSGYHRWLGYRE